jgi:predicted RNase H-like nuclease (RuvC/YqgF family)
MKVIGIATGDGRAYYSILSRLKKTNLRFVSMTPAQAARERVWPVITTRRELAIFEGVSIPIEELDENPLIMEGQILARTVRETRRVLLIGVDPGLRIGVAIYYGGVRLGSTTVNSVDLLQQKILNVVQSIPHKRAMVRIGDGYPKQSRVIAETVASELPETIVEIVNERGTSIGNQKGMTRDQVAAARIAFRKGAILGSAVP